MTARLTNRTERLIQMEQLLFRNASGLRAVEIAEACGVDRRTVYRDLSLLTEVGVPVQQKDGRFYLQREQYLATLRLSFNETMALLLAAAASQLDNPHLTSAMAKLSQSLPDSVAAHANVLTELTQHASDTSRTAMLDLLTRAWGEQRCIKLWYCSRDNTNVYAHEMSIYFIEPKPSGAVYVVGFDSGSSRVRAFKLDRIQQVDVLPTTYEMPFHFDTKRYLFYLRGAAKAKAGRADDHSSI